MDLYTYLINNSFKLNTYEYRLLIQKNIKSITYITHLTLNNYYNLQVNIINELFNLTYLNIDNNNITNLYILKLTKLKILTCKYNKITELHNELNYCIHIKCIDFSFNQLHFCYINKLHFEVVNVSFNKLNNIFIYTQKLICNNNYFTKIMYYKYLDISNCKINGNIYLRDQFSFLNISNNYCRLIIEKYNLQNIIIAKNIIIINEYKLNISNIIL